MDYDTFSISFEPELDGLYGTVARSSAGSEVRGRFRIPESTEEVLRTLESGVRGGEQGRARLRVALRHVIAFGSDDAPSLKSYGHELFEQLLSGDVGRLFDRSLGRAEEGRRGLHISLRLNVEHPGLSKLTDVPWELLYWQERREFLSLSRHTPVVRQLSDSRPARGSALKRPLRILVVVSSSPEGDLKLEAERIAIERTWGRSYGVEVSFLDRATFGGLRERMDEKPFHVLHFMGHGDFSPATGDGVLFFEDAEIDGSTLGCLLRDQTELRLVFVNACNSGRSSTEDGLDSVAGTATAVVKAGVPAVVAMQRPVSDGAAIAFCRAFYRKLALGAIPSVAVTAGRQALHSRDARSAEWTTPVLILRNRPESRSRERGFVAISTQSLSVLFLVMAIGLPLLWHIRPDGRSQGSGSNTNIPPPPPPLRSPPPASCGELTFNLEEGTLHGLNPTAAQDEIIKRMPCKESKETIFHPDDALGSGRVEYRHSGIRFDTGNTYIEVYDGFHGSIHFRGKNFGINQDSTAFQGVLPAPIRPGKYSYFYDIYDSDINRCLELKLANNRALERVRVHGKHCYDLQIH